ncbi:MAG: FecR domain-containing protein [Deltaproteobacteria bacterium]|jgi:hypothetical protein|nr:FecR domain-containing protein [Deltaproteobacteria bacterium]
MRLFFFLGLLLAAVFPPAPALAATGDIGKVIALTPGASVLRDGTSEGLVLHAGIRVSDTVRTDATGRVKILFNDDSALSLGSNTTMEMSEYADAGAKSAFGVKVPQGVIRAITGKITEQNPGGFKMTSPEASVGIRGTIVSMRVGRGVTTVYVENSLRRVYVNGIHVPGGSRITLPGERTEPIQPEDRRQLGRDLALLGGNGTAAAAPEPDIRGARRLPMENAAARPETFLPPDTLLKDLALGTSTLGDSPSLLATSPVPIGPPMGHVTGSIPLGASYAWSPSSANYGAFSFNVNLVSGAISNGLFALSSTIGGTPVTLNTGSGSMTALPGAGVSVSLHGGSGLASPGSFLMDTFAGGTVVVGATPFTGFHAGVSGSGNLMTMPAGPLPPGVGYFVTDASWNDIDAGTATGSITK